MKSIAGGLRLDLAQYRELAAFAQFGSDLDKASQPQLNRGKHLVEILKQDQYQPLPVEKQIMIIWAGTKGYLDDLAVGICRKFEAELYRFSDNAHRPVLDEIRDQEGAGRGSDRQGKGDHRRVQGALPGGERNGKIPCLV